MKKTRIKMKHKIRELLKKIVYKQFPLMFSPILGFIGYCIYRGIKHRYSNNVHIVFMRGATGDTFLVGRWIKAYLEKNGIESFIFVGDAGGIIQIMRLYGFENVISLSHFMAVCLQQFSIIMDLEGKDFHSMFLWPHTRYFNRCRVRMIRPFTFYDTYKYYVFDFYKDIRIIPTTRPYFNSIDTLKLLTSKSIILAPYANSIKVYTDDLWIQLIQKLKMNQYNILINCTNYENSFGCKQIFFNYNDSKAILEQAECFIGLRSGLCDVISSAKCKKIVLYPQIKKLNYSEHRSDIEFCSLKTLGLCNEVVELESNLIENITDISSKISKTEVEKEINKLVDSIIYHLQ